MGPLFSAIEDEVPEDWNIGSSPDLVYVWLSRRRRQVSDQVIEDHVCFDVPSVEGHAERICRQDIVKPQPDRSWMKKGRTLFATVPRGLYGDDVSTIQREW